MKTTRPHASRRQAFTLLEVVIVLAITALVLGAVHSLAQGTLTLADDLSRAERRDARTQAFTTFCEHLFGELPATAVLNLTVTQQGGDYLSTLELRHVNSPFDETPDCRVTLSTQGQPGGGLRLVITCQTEKSEKETSREGLFEDLAQCEWKVFHPTARQWTPFWSEASSEGAPSPQMHPKLIKLTLAQPGAEPLEQVFWIAPSESTLLPTLPITAPAAPNPSSQRPAVPPSTINKVR